MEPRESIHSTRTTRALYFIASNRKDGGVWLDRSDADRRISLIGVPKGRTPRLTLPYRIAQTLDLSEADAIKWMTQIGLPAFSNRHEVAKWLGHLLLTCNLSEQPRAYHEGSYVKSLNARSRCSSGSVKACSSTRRVPMASQPRSATSTRPPPIGPISPLQDAEHRPRSDGRSTLPS